MQKFDFDTMCTGCDKLVSGRLHFDSTMKLVDSDGGMLFSDGFKCHNCLGQPWSTADTVV